MLSRHTLTQRSNVNVHNNWVPDTSVLCGRSISPEPPGQQHSGIHDTRAHCDKEWYGISSAVIESSEIPAYSIKFYSYIIKNDSQLIVDEGLKQFLQFHHWMTKVFISLETAFRNSHYTITGYSTAAHVTAQQHTLQHSSTRRSTAAQVTSLAAQVTA